MLAESADKLQDSSQIMLMKREIGAVYTRSGADMPMRSRQRASILEPASRTPFYSFVLSLSKHEQVRLPRLDYCYALPFDKLRACPVPDSGANVSEARVQGLLLVDGIHFGRNSRYPVHCRRIPGASARVQSKHAA